MTCIGQWKPPKERAHDTPPVGLYRGVGSQTALEVPHEHEHECEDAQRGHAEPEIKHELPRLKTLRPKRELRGGKKVGEFGKAGFVTLRIKP
jgi:hypothetical protein